MRGLGHLDWVRGAPACIPVGATYIIAHSKSLTPCARTLKGACHDGLDVVERRGVGVIVVVVGEEDWHTQADVDMVHRPFSSWDARARTHTCTHMHTHAHTGADRGVGRQWLRELL